MPADNPSMENTALDDCGCCEPDLPTYRLDNPPGQPMVAFRLATHARFNRHMLSRLSRWRLPDGEHAGERPLAALTSRDPDDPAIAFVDAWSSVADVLSFYQERIANEAFLRTAVERRSVLELARAIGYELKPGVAAGAWLAFEVDENDSTPEETTVRAGTQVQSIPMREDELPRTFETSEDFVAHAGWNRLLPKLSEPQHITLNSPEILLDGINLDISVGDRLLLTGKDGDARVTAVRRRVRTVREDAGHGTTLVIFEASAAVVEKAGLARQAGGIEAKMSFSTSNPTTNSLATPAFTSVAFNAGNVDSLLDKGLSEHQFQAVLQVNGWLATDAASYLDGKSKPAVSGDIQVFILREKAAIFGHNAPHYLTLSSDARNAFNNWDDPDWEIWRDSISGTVNATKTIERFAVTVAKKIAPRDATTGKEYYADADIYLERPIADIVPDGWLLLERPGGYRIYRIKEAREGSLTGFGISGKVMGLELSDLDGVSLGNNSTDKDKHFKVRTTTAYAVDEELTPAPLPVTDDLNQGDISIPLNGLVLGLETGQAVVISGEQADAPGVMRSEVVFLDQVLHGGGSTTLKFSEGLAHAYKRDALIISANVTHATDGETVADEVLGSGDGAATFQRFKLRKPPLTHVSAATPSGTESTLSVRVDGVEWQPVPSLYGRGPGDRVYVARQSDDGDTFVQFGDGITGARPSTGQENITASYRSGIGFDGEVGAGSLTLLKKRPFGIKGVDNPLAASGADDPEHIEDARRNAPLTVLTLDRIISLRDFEDFARAYAGIGKARAVPLWQGERELVHISVADASGNEISEDSALFRNLRDAIELARDPLREVVLASFQRRAFELTARVLRDPTRRREDIEAAIRDALIDAFSFANRNFGEPVSSAEVIEVMHAVDGVEAVDIDKLYLLDDSGGQQGGDFSSVLPAATARAVTGGFLPAELLLINAFGITLMEMSA